MTDLSHWDGDGLPEESVDTCEFIEALGLVPLELDALAKRCEDEAWIREKMAKHEDRERNIAACAYFWRRAQRWKELAASMREEIDARTE